MVLFITTTADWNHNTVDFYKGTGVSVNHTAAPTFKLGYYFGRWRE